MTMIASASAFAGEAVQMWKCELDDDATEAQVKAGAAAWLKAAKAMKGGENLEAHVYFPVAVNDTAENDTVFVVIAPSFEEGGRFWDGYEGSAAAAQDKKNEEFAVCPDSAVWEGFQVE